MSIKAILVSCSLFVISVLVYNTTLTPNPYYQNTLLKQYAKAFYKQTVDYDSIAQRYAAGKTTKEQLQLSHLDTRLAYKKIEFFADFKYHNFIQDHINGAPLHKIKRVKNRAEVKLPEGLQVLDEMMFSNTLAEERSLIVPITKQLVFASKKLTNALMTEELSDTDLIVSTRLQMIRLFTLGLTGFDSPGSLNAINEAIVSLSSLKTFVEQSQISKKHKKEVIAYLNQGIHQLLNTDFENLDRLGFLKTVIDPVFKYLGKLKINTIAVDEILDQLPLNLESNSLFDEKLIDPYYYTDISQEEDNHKIKKLGETLFYNTALSHNNTVSCATCHNPKLAFTDGLSTPNLNNTNLTSIRNTPTLLNAVYADRYFYDLRAFTLEQQAEHVIFNADEFNTTYQDIITRLDTLNDFKQQFESAFNKTRISRASILKALSSYVMSLTSHNSKFDRYVRGESKDLTQDAKKGFNLFMGKAACATCHFPPTFSGLVPPYFTESESEVLGVLQHPDSLKLDTDVGRIANEIHTEQAWMYQHSFKTTTVRNVTETAPYFHNGAYTSLEQVIDFYNNGGGSGKGVKVDNQTLSSDVLQLSSKEQEQLIAFLNALSDNRFTDN